MPRAKRTPTYRKHSSGQAFAEIDGQRHYLGKHGTKESKRAYDRLIAEWLHNGRKLPVPPDDTTVVELCAEFLEHARIHYRHPDGSQTGEYHNVVSIMKPFVKLYGDIRVSEFGPKQLKTMRQTVIDTGVARVTANRYTNTIRRIVKWGVGEELVEPQVYGGLTAVDGLRAGRTVAPETDPVQPVPEADIDAVQPFVSRQVWACIQMQRLTAARPAEILRLTPGEIDRTGAIWLATPPRHKNAHRQKTRTIYIGPRGQDLLRPFLLRGLGEYLFSPREAEAERRAVDAESTRRDNQKPTPRKTDRVIRDAYDTNSYRVAIARACDAAGVTRWAPGRLRHNAATIIRRQFGLEAAQVILGHARADVTQVYAEVDRVKAMQVITEIG